MPESISGTSVYLMPGMSIEISSSLGLRNTYGWFAAQVLPEEYFSDLTYVGDILRGFVVEDTRNGTIASSSRDGTSVIYTHKRVTSNAIWFFAVDGKHRGLVNVISVPIHDHSSVFQGGPAYGTYFDDDVTEVR